MEMSPAIKKFIKENINLLENNQFQTLFNKADT